MRGSLAVAAAVLAGCGFTANPGVEHGDDDDGPAVTDAGTHPDALVPPGAQCPAGYASIGGSTSQYRFGGTAVRWEDAEEDCADDAASTERATHLVVLDDGAERNAVIAGLNDQWIGATDLAHEGDVRYVTAQGATLPINNPAMNADDKDCIRIKDNGNAEARDCMEMNKYICECDGQSPDRSRFPNLPNGNGNDSDGGGGGGGGIHFP